jgi:hypothetical protein
MLTTSREWGQVFETPERHRGDLDQDRSGIFVSGADRRFFKTVRLARSMPGVHRSEPM